MLHALGIPWKEVPSVKLVPKDQIPLWKALPHLSKEMLRTLADRKSILLATSYNKLKHGPQMVVMSPYQRAVEQRGLPETPESARGQIDVLHVRLLFDGARTQETQSDLDESTRVAPFLIHQPDVIEGVMINHATAAHSMRMLAYWLYRCVFGSTLEWKADPALVKIARWFEERIQARSY